MRLDSCELCPRLCHVNREAGGVGFCGQGAEMSVFRVSLHFWEEPCISGSSGSGTVFFGGCSLGCVTCQNVDISCPGLRGHDLSPEELAELFLVLEGKGACNINLVTPTHFWPRIADAITAARDRGLKLPIVCNTSGYERVETLKELDGLIDIYLPDCKFYSPELAERIARAPDYFDRAAGAIEEMVRQTGAPVFRDGSGNILDAREYNERAGESDSDGDYGGPLMVRGTIVRHLLLPGELDDGKRVVTELFKRFGDDIYLSLMSQYTPMPSVSSDAVLGKRISRGDYDELVDFAIGLGLENGFFQGPDTDTESFIPDFSEGDEGNLMYDKG